LCEAQDNVGNLDAFDIDDLCAQMAGNRLGSDGINLVDLNDRGK
jgi:hypothetical protein